jgi:hypothetical protein
MMVRTHHESWRCPPIAIFRIYGLKLEGVAMLSLFVRFVIIVTVVVSITDAIVFYEIWKNPERLTPLFVMLVIIVTVIPIAVNLWWWLVFKASP